MKKRLASILLAVAFSIAAIACQPASTELTDEQKAAIADSVTQLSAEMQSAFDLDVPLKTDARSGPNWYMMEAD